MGWQRATVKAGTAGAVIGVGMIAIGEWAGITRLHVGYCCGYERDILPTYVNVVWAAAVAACVGAVGALSRAGGASPAARIGGCAGAAVGGAAALPLLAYFASSTPESEVSLAAGSVVGAYACGLALGLVVALLLEATPVRRTAAPFGIAVASGIYYVIQLANAVFHAPLQDLPGGMGFRHSNLSLGLVMLMLGGFLFGSVAAFFGDRLVRLEWRRGWSWATLLAGLAGLAVLTWGCAELTRIPGGPPLVGVRASFSLVYAGIGLGIAAVARRRDSSWLGLAATATGGLVLLASATRVALAVGPKLSGGGALEASTYAILLGVIVAAVGGALIGSLPQVAVWTRDQGTSAHRP